MTFHLGSKEDGIQGDAGYHTALSGTGTDLHLSTLRVLFLSPLVPQNGTYL